MSGFEFLRAGLDELLTEKQIAPPNTLQVKFLQRFRSGANLLLEAADGLGKTRALLVAILHKIDQPGEGSPRALVICKDDEDARTLHADLAKLAKYDDLTVDLALDKGNMLQQRNDIFDGTEIIVGTPKRMHDLYIQNGFNVSQLKLFVLDDIQSQMKKGHCAHLKRLAESLPRCQFVLSSYSFTDKRVAEFIDEYLPIHEVISE